MQIHIKNSHLINSRERSVFMGSHMKMYSEKSDCDVESQSNKKEINWLLNDTQ